MGTGEQVWTATVSIPGRPDEHASGVDRDAIVAMALGYVPDAERDAAAKQLGWRPGLLWLLPARRASWSGGTIVVSRGDLPPAQGT
jgi:hypothetical protein